MTPLGDRALPLVDSGLRLRVLRSAAALMLLAAAGACETDEFLAGEGEVSVVSDVHSGATADAESRDDASPDEPDVRDESGGRLDVDDEPGDVPDELLTDPNECGGQGTLLYEGAAAAPGDACGCGGALACHVGELLCRGSLPRNVCGGCVPLEPGVESDGPCGECEDGVWLCEGSDALRCEGGSSRNGCGQCEDDPGDRCEATCGDGVLDRGEDCDEGDENSDAPGASCRLDCTLGRCGDGIVDPGEECDEGVDNADALSARCATACTIIDCMRAEYATEGVSNPWIVFTSNPSREVPLHRLYVSRFHRDPGEQPYMIETGDVIHADPAWSPDGTRIAFRAPGQFPQLLRILDVRTGEVITLEHGLGFWTNPTWGPDEDSITVEARLVGELDRPPTLYRVPLDGSGAERILPIGTATAVMPMSSLPEHLLFAIDIGADPFPFQAARWSCVSGGPTMLPSFGSVVGRISADVARGTYLVQRGFIRDEEQASELLWFDGPDGDISVTVGTEEANSPALARGAQWAAFVDRDATDRMAIFAIDRATPDTPRQLTQRTLWESSPAVSPLDSDEIPVFWHNGGGP